MPFPRRLRCVDCGRACDNFSEAMLKADASERVCRQCEQAPQWNHDPDVYQSPEEPMQRMETEEYKPPSKHVDKPLTPRRYRCNGCGIAKKDFREEMVAAPVEERLCMACEAEALQAMGHEDARAKLAHRLHGRDVRSEHQRQEHIRAIRCNGCGHAREDFTKEMMAAPAEFRLCKECEAKHLSPTLHQESHAEQAHYIHGAAAHHQQKELIPRAMRCSLCGHASKNFAEDMVHLPPKERKCKDCLQEISERMAKASAQQKRTLPPQPTPRPATAGQSPQPQGSASLISQTPRGGADTPHHHGHLLTCSQCGRATKKFSIAMNTKHPSERVCLNCEKIPWSPGMGGAKEGEGKEHHVDPMAPCCGDYSQSLTPRRYRCNACGHAHADFSEAMINAPVELRLCRQCEKPKEVELSHPEMKAELAHYAHHHPAGHHQFVERAVRCNGCGHATEDFSAEMWAAPVEVRLCSQCEAQHASPLAHAEGRTALAHFTHAHPAAHHEDHALRPIRCNGCGHAREDFTKEMMAAPAEFRLCKECEAKHLSPTLHQESHAEQAHYIHGAAAHHEGLLPRPMRCSLCGHATKNFAEEMQFVPRKERKCRDCLEDISQRAKKAAQNIEAKKKAPASATPRPGAAQTPRSMVSQTPRSVTSQQLGALENRGYAGRQMRCVQCGRASKSFRDEMATKHPSERVCMACEQAFSAESQERYESAKASQESTPAREKSYSLPKQEARTIPFQPSPVKEEEEAPLSDEERWNKKFTEKGYDLYVAPSEFLEECLEFVEGVLPGESLEGARALDIACGNGKNSVFLAQHGADFVDAIDVSTVGLQQAGKLASHRGFTQVQTIQLDLETVEAFPSNRYDLVICFFYLNRSLFPMMKDCLKPGGVLIYETFTQGQENMPKEYLLQHNELLAAFQDFENLHYEEMQTESGKHVARIICKKPSTRGNFLAKTAGF